METAEKHSADGFDSRKVLNEHAFSVLGGLLAAVPRLVSASIGHSAKRPLRERPGGHRSRAEHLRSLHGQQRRGDLGTIPETCGIGDDLDGCLDQLHGGRRRRTTTFDTIDSDLSDTTLAVYSACGGTQLGCNDDIDNTVGNFWSSVTVPMTVGETVLVRVAGYQDDSGSFFLNVIGTVTPGNDPCAGAETITVNQVKSGNTAGAATDIFLDDSACGINAGAGGGKDVFYAFTPTTTGSYDLSLCGSGFNTVLAVLSDCTGDPSTVLACNDNSGACTTNPLASEIQAFRLPFSAGVHTILIRVSGFL